MVGAGGATVLATLAGYGLAKFDFPGKRGVFAIVLGAVAVPGTALAVPTFLLFSDLAPDQHPLGGHPAVPGQPARPLPDLGLRARRDAHRTARGGARSTAPARCRTFFSISSGCCAPGMITVLLFTVVATWNNYFLPLIMLSQPNWYPLTVGLNDWNAQSPDRRRTARLQPRHHRLAAHRHPDHDRVPVHAALLAVRTGRREREAVTPACRRAPTVPTHESGRLTSSPDTKKWKDA